MLNTPSTLRAFSLLLCATYLLLGCVQPPVETGPPPPERVAIALARFGPDLAVPMACFSQSEGLKRGDDCTPFLPDSGELQATDGMVLRFSEHVYARCEGGQAARALRLSAEKALGPLKAPALAAWPSLEDIGFVPSMTSTTTELPDGLATYTASWQSTESSAATLQVRGRTLEFLTLIERDERGDAQTRLLLLKEPEGWRVLLRSTTETATVLGGVDLDHDGVLEIWLAITHEDGAGDAIITIKEGAIEVLGEWSC